MDIQCPVCKTDGVVEDMGDHEDFLSGYCDECGASYAYSVMAGNWIYVDTDKCKGQYHGVTVKVR